MWYQRLNKINAVTISALLIFFVSTLFGNWAEKNRAPERDESDEILVFKNGKWQLWDSSYIGVLQVETPAWWDGNAYIECKICIDKMELSEIEITEELHFFPTTQETTAILLAEMQLPADAIIKDITEYIFFPYIVDTTKTGWGMCGWAKKKNLTKGLSVEGNKIILKGVITEETRIVVKYVIPTTIRNYEIHCGKAVFQGKKHGAREKSRWNTEGDRFWIEVFDDSARVRKVTKTPYGEVEQLVSKIYSNRIEQLAKEMKKMSIVYYPYPHQISPALMDSIKTGKDIGAMFLSAANILASISYYPHCEIINIEKSVATSDSQAKYEGYYITESPIWIKVLGESISAEENLKKEIAEYKLFLSYDDSIDYVNSAFELAQIWDKTLQKKSLPFFLPDNPTHFWELIKKLHLLDRKRESKLKEETEKRRKETWGWYWKQRDLLQIREELEKAILNAERSNYLNEVARLRKEAANIESKMQ